MERAGGITRAIVAPSAVGSFGDSGARSIFAGQGAVIDLGVDSSPVTRPRAFQYVELGELGAQEAGGSRPAAYATLRDAFGQARDYARSPKDFGGRERESLVKRPDAAALLLVLEGKMPLLVHVERSSDITSVLALKNDYPHLNLVLVGAAKPMKLAKAARSG